jgi:hypothetical protein
MQKAIYYVSRLIAARGVIELTDRHLNFQVSSLDMSFGIKDVSVDLATVDDVRIEGGDLHPRVIISSGKKYEFVVPRAQELYDLLKKLCCSSITAEANPFEFNSLSPCKCGKFIDNKFNYCPWCGSKLHSS